MNDVTKDLLERIADISQTYDRFGATCTFEGQPMMHLSHLEEIAELAARAEAALAEPQPDALEQARAEEREACALVCESRESPGTGSVAILRGAASAIRARGERKYPAPMRSSELRDDAVGVFKP